MKSKTKRIVRTNLIGFLFIIPLLAYFLLFQLAPMVLSFIISFTDWEGFGAFNFIGLQNYIAVLTNQDNLYPYFWKSLLVTIEYILLTVPLSIACALVVSALLNNKIKGETFFKTAFYIPSCTAAVANIVLWKFMLDPNYGMINQIFGTNVNFLGKEGLDLVMISLMSVWGGVGYNVLIMLSAMKNIDSSLYEVARIEGVSGFKQFLHITIPGVMPTIFFFLVTGLIGGFQCFEAMYLMTGTGVNHSTYTYIYGVYETSMTNGQLGLGSAMSYLLFVLILGITIIQFRMLPQDTTKSFRKFSRKKTNSLAFATTEEKDDD